MAIRSTNPATGETEAEFAEWTAQETDAALADAAHAFDSWRKTIPVERAAGVRRIGAVLRERKEHLAALITAEMGKPIAQSREEIEKCADCCDYFASNGPGMVSAEEVAGAATRTRLSFEPIGPVLAVMPWNYPFWQLFRFAAPTLVAGNTVLLKHASNVPRCARAMESVVREAGLPPGVLRTMLIGGAAAEALIADERIRAVTFTGSNEAGAKVAAAAGRACKKSVLELGGSDPFVVLADADVDAAIEAAIAARFARNTGQSCNAPKRFIVESPLLQLFTSGLVDAVARLRVGDPRAEATEAGPMARADLRDALREQVERSVAAGARLLIGGTMAEGRGYYFTPAVVDRVTPGMAVFDEETFGPLAAITAARDEAEAIELANRTRFGLAASIWTAEIDRGERLAARIDAGSIAINGTVTSQPGVPFGGVKDSGYGRELSSFGLREFVNVKALAVSGGSGATE